MPAHHSMKTGLLEGSVTARYTYGMPVKGKLTVTLHYHSFDRKKNNITKHFEINGFSKFGFTDLDLKKLMRYEDTHSDTLTFGGPVDVVAVVNEDLTDSLPVCKTQSSTRLYCYLPQTTNYFLLPNICI
ncbi:unnamed protein product [Ranitomeya imitator]|uniref:Macroglobulin domain-containing protein n=1 Tax=Ranitomeya imitator TaxID=111125 RepID=A0ABN9M6L5_9NEOB|nr:unnamed protein product [Ranitomeya imitator]